MHTLSDAGYDDYTIIESYPHNYKRCQIERSINFGDSVLAKKCKLTTRQSNANFVDKLH